MWRGGYGVAGWHGMAWSLDYCHKHYETFTDLPLIELYGYLKL